ncbi:MAG: aspartate carbamoyltransferase catalytic subunit [Armatimonadetes bacterium]|nr:aspartate carbamoyltransferase catalytic subunit [Armatimonadota bacterium]MDE2205555.1 aspartate carbamoyltransferase catalytic subunit [Armatimonadota bacterium]
MKHLLSLRETPANEIGFLLQTAAVFREILDRPIRKVPTLRGRSVVTLFYESSTRTRTSFEMAAKIMSAEAVNVAVALSSVTKGESFKDTVQTLQALKADCIVIRHSASGAPAFAAARVDVPVINAGDGRHEHPTQALLDMLTMQQHFGRIEGLKVAIVGDVLHSRVARSNIWGLTKMGAKVTLAAPRTLMPEGTDGLPAAVADCLDEAVCGADVVMVLRLQNERMQAALVPNVREYSRLFGVTPARLRHAAHGLLVMHPGPVNRGVEISSDLVDGVDGIHTAIGEQVTNGIAVRMAALYILMGGGSIGEPAAE